VRRDIAALEALVDDHDVAFLLTDTRESRWLPTLLCAARGRLALTAALGFDGFMVIRHGAPLPPEAPREQAPVGQKERQEEEEAHAQEGAAEAAGEGGADEAAVEAGPGAALEAGECGAVMAGGGQAPDEPESAPAAPQEKQRPPPPPVAASRGAPLRLGCYFCNDVVAPLNSTADRALDQQCTVARPGLSAIAGSLAVELMAAVVAHPLGAAAPPPGTPAAAAAAKADGPPPLGDPPHMVRGSLAAFSQLCLTGQSFRQCTACSEVVVTQYRQRGHDFLLQARGVLFEGGSWVRTCSGRPAVIAQPRAKHDSAHPSPAATMRPTQQGLLSPASLEDLTGLTELHRASEAALEAWGSSDEEEGEGEGEGGCQGGSKPQNASSGDATAADGDEWEEL
jgi:ubiquitin-like modifier-activating enzyme ATG7